MGRTSLKAIRQQEIVNAFYTVAKKTGLENASIGKVADHLNINPSLIVHYFSNKESLLQALIDFTLDQYSAIYQNNGSEYASQKELKALIDNLFSRKWSALFDDGVFYSCYALTYRDRKLRASFRSLHDSLRTFLVDALKKARKNGVISISNERETAEIIFALIEGGYYYLGMTDAENTYASKMKILKKQAYQLLGID